MYIGNVFICAFKVPGQGPTSYLDAAQREKALQSMQQMSSAQIVSATANMHPRYTFNPPFASPSHFSHSSSTLLNAQYSPPPPPLSFFFQNYQFKLNGLVITNTY